MTIELNPRTYLAVAVGLIVGAAATVRADYTFGTPTNLGPEVNNSGYDIGPTVSQDELTIIFNSPSPSYTEEGPLLMATRASTDDLFGVPVRLDPTMFSGAAYPSISADGLSLYFEAAWPGGSGASDIWVTIRASVDDQWGTPVNLGPVVNSSAHELFPNISSDGLELYFSDGRAFAGESQRPGGAGGGDIWVTKRASLDAPWEEPVNLGPVVNSPLSDGDPSISSDDLALFFISRRPGGFGTFDIWLTTRAGTDEPWREPVNLGHPINTSGEDALVEIARDGSMLYFASTRPGGSGGMDLWQVAIEPVVDLNGDGDVDSDDMGIMVDHWHTDNTLCDIAPPPFGDGIVDVLDLVALSAHLFEKPGLVAHWKLDEIQGDIAYDSAGLNDAVATGGALWQPNGGQIDGAILLDGLDDVVIAGPALNPADGPISVLAWIKGGAPGQTVISQQDGANWLGTDPLEGYLMTGLTSSGRSATSLLSETTITDGQWHRIGFVWDGLYRTLYVDGRAVAQDTQNNLESSSNGLYIGTGKDMAPGTFFSGLIDDVRIYNRAVKP